MRTIISHTVSDIPAFKKGLLQWAQQFREVVWLDSHGHTDKYTSFDGLLAVDAHSTLLTDGQNAFEELTAYRKNTDDWLFGYLSYDLKNNLEQLTSTNFDGLGFPALQFFRPKRMVKIVDGKVLFMYLGEVAGEIERDREEIEKTMERTMDGDISQRPLQAIPRMDKEEYLDRVAQLLAHIKRGDIYEANFCQEFFVEGYTLDPLAAYFKLMDISEPPFATYLKLGTGYALSASPERYLKKQGINLISQPIKGTKRRSRDARMDHELVLELSADPKERAENIMIVDLVRNDLSKTAVKGSVQVVELCKVYTFKQVHQMISTIVADVTPDQDPVQILKGTFPMGSMTGAPKLSAMKIIEGLELTKRGLYSGAVGYFTPEGDFDFNVVIRSILYNASKKYISFSVGSAITGGSVPEKEFEECLLKAAALRAVLEGA